MRWEVSDRTAVVLCSAAFRIFSKHDTAFLCSFHLALSPCVSLRVQVVHSYSSADTATVWKKSRFILSEIIFPYNRQPVNNSPSVCWHTLFVDEILLSRYMNWSQISEAFLLKGRWIGLSELGLCFIWVDAAGKWIRLVYLREALDNLNSRHLTWFLCDIVFLFPFFLNLKPFFIRSIDVRCR